MRTEIAPGSFVLFVLNDHVAINPDHINGAADLLSPGSTIL